MRGNPHFPQHSTTALGSIIPGESSIQIFDSHDSSDQESAETTYNGGNLILVQLLSLSCLFGHNFTLPLLLPCPFTNKQTLTFDIVHINAVPV